MSKQVSIPIYRYDELSDEAKYEARVFIESELYELEIFWMNESLDDFKRHIFDDEQYSFDQLPQNICYEFDFNENLGKYEGVMPGESLIKAFRAFLEDTYEHLTFSDSDIQYAADEENLWFYDNGRLFSRG